MKGSAVVVKYGDERKTFPDDGAEAIWNSAQGSSFMDVSGSVISSTYVCINFMKIVHSVATLNAKLYIFVDDVCDVIVNGILLQHVQGYSTSTSVSITLKPGDNIIRLQAMNTFGPGALLATIIADSTGKVLAHTDTSWNWSTICT